MTAFTGDHYRQLREALVEAFPEPARLKELCQFALGRNLARVTTGGSLDEQAFELIGHAQATGSLDELIKGAWELNDGSPHLRAFFRDLAPGWCFNLPEATLDARCLPIGHRIQKWKVLRHLGAGGMGTVYAVSAGYAESALKVLHAVAEQEDDGGDFERDVGRVATLTSNLRTDGVVKVHEGAFDPSLKVRWIRMDLVRGESLRARVRRDGRLQMSELREVAEQLYDALTEAHGAAGAIIHCDIKPENLFVERTRRGLRLKVLDFGIARLAHERPMEKGGPAYGTALYAAPELWDGAAVSPATDVWSCALTVFYLLTGGEFWVSRYDQQLAEEIVASPQRSASARARELGVALPEGLVAWFAECLTADPARRPASAEVAWQALRTHLSAFSDGALPVVAVEQPRAKDDAAVPEGAHVPSAVVASGVRLTQWLKERGPLPPQDVVKVAADVSAAIAVLRGIPGVRGTLEPERIVLETAADGSIQGARVVDIEARAVAGGRAARGRTATLQLQRRFVRYSNPAMGFGGEVAAPDDVWSLAMIAYEMLTGAAFVAGMDARRWAELASAPIAASARAAEQGVAAGLPRGFDAWFSRCVTSDPSRRYRSAREVAAAMVKVIRASTSMPVIDYVSPPTPPRDSVHPRAVADVVSRSPPPRSDAPIDATGVARDVVTASQVPGDRAEARRPSDEVKRVRAAHSSPVAAPHIEQQSSAEPHRRAQPLPPDGVHRTSSGRDPWSDAPPRVAASTAAGPVIPAQSPGFARTVGILTAAFLLGGGTAFAVHLLLTPDRYTVVDAGTHLGNREASASAIAGPPAWRPGEERAWTGSFADGDASWAFALRLVIDSEDSVRGQFIWTATRVPGAAQGDRVTETVTGTYEPTLGTVEVVGNHSSNPLLFPVRTYRLRVTSRADVFGADARNESAILTGAPIGQPRAR